MQILEIHKYGGRSGRSKIALLFFGILIRIVQFGTPVDFISTDLEKPENLGFYACSTLLKADRKNSALEKLFPTVINVHYNPGPIKYPCTGCDKPVRNSYFESSSILNSSAPNTPEVQNVNNTCIFNDLREVRKSAPSKFRIAHLNINSLRYKYDELKPILTDNLVDFMVISETKLDSSFRNSLFEAEGYKLQRRDRDDRGGGLAIWVREDIASRRRSDLESDQIECIVFEVMLDKLKWIIHCVYRPPSMQNDTFLSAYSKMIDKGIQYCDNYIVIGDFNYDLISVDKSQTLVDLCDLFNMENTISEPTCFKSNCNPSLVDVILTNKPGMCEKTVNFNTGISDCHHLISVGIKSLMPSLKPKKCAYRSFKNFDLHNYQKDLGKIKPPPEYQSHLDVNELYDTFINEISQVIDKHAPVKTRFQRKQPVPYMNADLRKAIYNKQKLRNKFEKSKTNYNWEMFRKQRNFVTKLKRKSIQMYFLERCAGGQKSKDFWPTIKPFLSKKHKTGQQKIILKCEETIVNDTRKVCNTFNKFFVNVAEGIGKGVSFDQETHPSIKAIKENRPDIPVFDFQLTNTEAVSKIISKINVKKATGVDNFSAKLLKADTHETYKKITNTGCLVLVQQKGIKMGLSKFINNFIDTFSTSDGKTTAKDLELHAKSVTTMIHCSPVFGLLFQYSFSFEDLLVLKMSRQSNSRGKQVRTPEAVHRYNYYMGGIDVGDQMILRYELHMK
ncbi:hypothetical protein KUTeg_014863, partial [Tegillarca granosa]